jgi:hypothetical protein
VRFRHGPLELELPEGWADQSTLAFVAPAEAPRVLTTAAVTPPTEAVQINFVAGAPDSILEAQAAELGEEHRVEVLERRDFSCALGAGRLFHQRMTLAEQSLDQLVFAVAVGDATVLASAACATERFAAKRATLEGVLASIGASS